MFYGLAILVTCVSNFISNKYGKYGYEFCASWKPTILSIRSPFPNVCSYLFRMFIFTCSPPFNLDVGQWCHRFHTETSIGPSENIHSFVAIPWNPWLKSSNLMVKAGELVIFEQITPQLLCWKIPMFLWFSHGFHGQILWFSVNDSTSIQPTSPAPRVAPLRLPLDLEGRDWY